MLPFNCYLLSLHEHVRFRIIVVLLAGDASVNSGRLAPARFSRDFSYLSRLIYLREGIGSVWGVEVEGAMAFSLKNIVVGCR